MFGEGGQVSSGAEGEQLVKRSLVERPKNSVNEIPVKETPVEKSVASAPIVKAKPVPPAKFKPSTKPKATEKVSSKPVKKTQPAPKKATHKADSPPVAKSDQQFIGKIGRASCRERV